MEAQNYFTSGWVCDVIAAFPKPDIAVITAQVSCLHIFVHTSDTKNVHCCSAYSCSYNRKIKMNLLYKLSYFTK